MRDVPAQLAEHLAGGATTTCHAWRLTRSDGLVLGFTEHDRELEFAGTVFAAASGFQAGEVESGLGLAADAAEVLGAFSSTSVTREDLADGRYDGALVETFLVNWQAPDQHMLLSTRELGEVRAGSDAFRAELRSLAGRLDAPQGRVYSKACDADLGDARCGVDLEDPAYKAAGAVAAVDDAGAVRAEGIEGFADGWFGHGRIIFQSGRLAGLEFAIGEHRLKDGASEFVLWSQPSAPPAVGDLFEIYAGCDKRRETCRAKFSNLLNFQGFPFMPGSDFAYGYADGDGVHDGRPVVR